MKKTTLPFWSEEIESIILEHAKGVELSESQWWKLYHAFNEMVKMQYYKEIAGRGYIHNDGVMEEMINDVTTHLMIYTLPKFKPEKLTCKFVNFFIICSRRELQQQSKKVLNHSKIQIPEDDFLRNESVVIRPEEKYLSLITPDNEQETITDAQREFFKDMYHYFTVVNPLAKHKRNLQVLKTAKLALDGQLPFKQINDKRYNGRGKPSGYVPLKAIGEHLNLSSGTVSSALRQLVKRWLKSKGFARYAGSYDLITPYVKKYRESLSFGETD